MSALTDFITAYNELSYSDRVVFYTTVSNDVNVSEDNLQSFLIETRITDKRVCVYCSGEHVVKNGTRKDGTQRYLCRDCRKSFIPSSHSVTSRTKKHLSVWAKYLRCMMEKKTLAETAEECHIALSTSFAWRHKILASLGELADKVYLEGTVEADETCFNVSYKGNHSKSTDFSMPRPAHKRGNDNHTKGLSSEKVCVPCAISEGGLAYARPEKLGKASSECIEDAFDGIISPGAILRTDNEKAYRAFAGKAGIALVQTDTDCRTVREGGDVYGLQQVNAYKSPSPSTGDLEGAVHGVQQANAFHRSLKAFIRRFHGVSTKHLGNYIVWNDLISCNHGKREELLAQLLGQVLCVRKTLYYRDIPRKAPLPGPA